MHIILLQLNCPSPSSTFSPAASCALGRSRRGRPASREAWSGHSTTSLEGTWTATAFVSQTNLAKISPSASRLHVMRTQPLTLQ